MTAAAPTPDDRALRLVTMWDKNGVGLSDVTARVNIAAEIRVAEQVAYARGNADGANEERALFGQAGSRAVEEFRPTGIPLGKDPWTCPRCSSVLPSGWIHNCAGTEARVREIVMQEMNDYDKEVYLTERAEKRLREIVTEMLDDRLMSRARAEETCRRITREEIAGNDQNRMPDERVREIAREEVLSVYDDLRPRVETLERQAEIGVRETASLGERVERLEYGDRQALDALRRRVAALECPAGRLRSDTTSHSPLQARFPDQLIDKIAAGPGGDVTAEERVDRWWRDCATKPTLIDEIRAFEAATFARGAASVKADPRIPHFEAIEKALRRTWLAGRDSWSIDEFDETRREVIRDAMRALAALRDPESAKKVKPCP